MTVLELKDRLNKAEAKVEKINKTIERHRAQAKKKLDIIQANGWELNTWNYVGGGPTPNEDAYWTICEFESKMSDVTNAQKKLEEAKQVVENWKIKLAKQQEIETAIANEIPDVLKQVRNHLVESWVQYDLEEKVRIYSVKHRMLEEENKSYREYRQVIPYSREEAFQRTEEEFRKIEEREADIWLLDLYNRIKDITGEITDTSGIRWGGKCLDGVVKGKKAMAVVDTIVAGGYNIQRLHYRTLVKEFKVKEG